MGSPREGSSLVRFERLFAASLSFFLTLSTMELTNKLSRARSALVSALLKASCKTNLVNDCDLQRSKLVSPVCVCVRVCLCVSVCLCVRASVSASVHARVLLNMCTHLYVHVRATAGEEEEEDL